MRTSFFLPRRTLREANRSLMPRGRSALARQAHDASRHFAIPAERAVEVRTQITV